MNKVHPDAVCEDGRKDHKTAGNADRPTLSVDSSESTVHSDDAARPSQEGIGKVQPGNSVLRIDSNGELVGEEDERPPGKCLIFFETRIEPYMICPSNWKEWTIFALIWGLIAAAVIVLIIRVYPNLIDNVVDPAITSLNSSLSDAVIGLIVVVSIILFPIVFIPMIFSVWLAALVFSFGIAVLIVVIATTIGMMIPYYLGRRYFEKRILWLLNRYKPTKVALLAVDKAGAFKVVLLLRLSPVPYPVVNYVAAVPANMKFWKYELASVIGMIPRNVVGVLFGRSLKGLSELIKGESLDAGQLAYTLVGLASTVIFLIGGFWYARRELRKINAQEEADAAAAAEKEAAEIAAASADSDKDGGGYGDGKEGALVTGLPVQGVPLEVPPTQEMGPREGAMLFSSTGASPSALAWPGGIESEPKEEAAARAGVSLIAACADASPIARAQAELKGEADASPIAACADASPIARAEAELKGEADASPIARAHPEQKEGSTVNRTAGWEGQGPIARAQTERNKRSTANGTGGWEGQGRKVEMDLIPSSRDDVLREDLSHSLPAVARAESSASLGWGRSVVTGSMSEGNSESLVPREIGKGSSGLYARKGII